ncbi:MAG: c-type cytochrome domain-containing protein [Planctomycetota bacterium]
MSFQLPNPASCLVCLTLFLLFSGAAIAQEKTAKITFDDHAKPILVQRCSSCHNGQKREGDLDVTNYTNLMQGGGSGTVIEPLDASGSYLYNLITHEDSPEMPPNGVKIPDADIKMIGQWIDGGALENKGSAAAKPKPKLNMSLAANPNARPEMLPTPFRIPLEPVITPKRSSVLAIATNPWAPVVAVSAPKQIVLYDSNDFQLKGVLPFEEGSAHSLRFSRSGQLLIAGGGKDGAVGKTVIFDARTGDRLMSVGDELETVLSADMSPNQEYVAYGGPNKLVKLLYTDGTIVAEIKKHTDWVTAVEFSPDGKYLATGDRNGGLHVWDGETGDPVFTLKGHTKQISEVSWRSDGQFLASASEDTTVRIWEMKNGRQVKSWGAHSGGVTGVEFRRDGNLITAGRDRQAKLWNQDGKMQKAFAGLKDVVVAVSICDETNRVFAADWTGVLKAWNAVDGKPMRNLAANPPSLATKLAFFQSLMGKANKDREPLAAQVTQSQAEITSIQQSLTAANQSMVGLQSKMTATEGQLAATKKQLESTSTQHQQWRTERDANTKAKPPLAAALAKAQEASAALPKDAELKTAVVGLTNKLNQINARVVELTGLVEKSGQEKTTTQSQMDALNQVAVATKTALDATTKQVAQLQGNLAAKNAAYKTQMAALQQAETKVANVTNLVKQCQSDIDFVEQLKSLQAELTAVEQDIVAKQSAVDEAHQKMVAAQKLVDEAKQRRSDSEQKSTAVRDQIETIRGQK